MTTTHGDILKIHRICDFDRECSADVKAVEGSHGWVVSHRRPDGHEDIGTFAQPYIGGKLIDWFRDIHGYQLAGADMGFLRALQRIADGDDGR